MPKNIVITCDGTGNEYGNNNTNVVKLFSALQRDETQVAYYDPGVGTVTSPTRFTAAVDAVKTLFGLAFGAGFFDNVSDAYRFLMTVYQPGDRVFLFGFSRGAYTVRALAAMIYKCGLLERKNENLLPYAIRLLKYERDINIYSGFRKTFARHCDVHFLGLWDTVKSIGWIYDPLRLQFTMNNPIVRTVRQALAIDERRCFYRQNLWGTGDDRQDVKQVWFAGAHSDVGGSYPPKESGLSEISLHWMIEEARLSGLRLRPEQPLPSKNGYRPVQPSIVHHRSLKGIWWLAEILPKLYADPRAGFRQRFTLPLGRRRYIGPGPLVHESVVELMQQGYRPPNLPDDYEVYEPGVRVAAEPFARVSIRSSENGGYPQTHLR